MRDDGKGDEARVKVRDKTRDKGNERDVCVVTGLCVHVFECK